MERRLCVGRYTSYATVNPANIWKVTMIGQMRRLHPQLLLAMPATGEVEFCLDAIKRWSSTS